MDSLKKDLTKTGLIIEGGGMRGIFAAGVVDYFLDKDIVFDNVIGRVSRGLPRLRYVGGREAEPSPRLRIIWTAGSTAACAA